MGADEEVRSRLKTLETRLRRLRQAPGPHDASAVGELEREVDQLWDLLRQRDARRGAGQEPDRARLRPQSEVEGYRQ